MREFGMWLAAELEARRMSQTDLWRAAGVTSAAVSRWLSGEDRPGTTNCRKIARALGLPEEEVLRRAGHLGGEIAPAAAEPSLSEALNRAARRLREIETEYEVLPVLGTASAGQTRLGAPSEILWKPKRRQGLGGRRYAIEVFGGCMAPMISQGDFAVVDPDISWRKGQLVAVEFDGGYQVKRLGIVGETAMRLESLNEPAFDVPLTDARVVGVVIAHWREFEW